MDSSEHQSATAATDARAASDPQSPTDALKSAALHFAEVKSYFSDFVAAKADAARLSLRRLILLITFGLLGAVTAAVVLATAIILLLNGLANSIGAIFTPPKPWIGQIIVGALILAATVFCIGFLIRKITATSHLKTTRKFEALHDRQRLRFGQDVNDAAMHRS